MVNSNKLQTLKSPRDFEEIRKSGRKVQPNPWLILSYLNNDKSRLRCGWTIPKYVGPAVIRNRLKRWCREFFRKEDLNLSLDLNVVLRRREKDFYKKLKHEEFNEALVTAMAKIKRPKNSR